MRLACALVLSFALGATAQTALPAPRVETPVLGLDRKDAATILWNANDATKIALHDFTFNGDNVSSAKLHFHDLGDGAVEITSVAYAVGDWEFQVGDHPAEVYGLGEHGDTLNHAHTVVHNLARRLNGARGSTTAKPVPFFLSGSGYGIWVDTTGDGTFDFNATSNDNIDITATSARLRVVLFAGPKYSDILAHFTQLAGRTVQPPAWAFAPWVGRDTYVNDTEVHADVVRMRSLGLPASAFALGLQWASNYGDYTFNPKQWQNPQAMIKDLHAQGYKLMLWQMPWVNTQTNEPADEELRGKMTNPAATYADAAAKGFFIKKTDGSPYVGKWSHGTGSLLDLTNTAAKQWWQDEMRSAIKLGADGFLDGGGEGDLFSTDGSTMRFSDGTDARSIRNKYTALYNSAVQEVIGKDLQANGVLLQSSATVGNQNLPVTRGGEATYDFNEASGLPILVREGISAGLSGIALWAAVLDVPKDGQPLDQAVFARWAELSAYSPVMMLHAVAGALPWDYSQATLEIYRRYAKLHTALFPYISRASQESEKTGLPIVGGLMLAAQDDPKARGVSDEYLFGPDLLVAPVLHEETQRAVYFPAGKWIDLETGTVQAGGTTAIVDASLAQIPAYARAGAVVPKMPGDVVTLVPTGENGNTQTKALDSRRVYEIIPGFEGSANTQTDFEARTLTRDAQSLKIEGKDADVTIRWKFARIASASVNGSPAQIQQTTEGAEVHFNHTDTSTVTWR